MSTSIWPADYLKEIHDLDREDANHLIVFLASPFNPKDKYDDLKDFCQLVCDHVGEILGAKIECRRADTSTTPIVIHQEIWNLIQLSDAIIVDVTDRNGNVMFELGVAASIRDKNQIILLSEEPDTGESSKGRFLFDIGPARHLTYKRRLSTSADIFIHLRDALLFSLAPAPFVPPGRKIIELPLNLDLTNQEDCEYLLSPSNTHRRMIDGGLEFGSFYLFRKSWLSFGNDEYEKIRVKGQMRFTGLKPGQKEYDTWIGIRLRGSHFLANFGHLVYVKADGSIWCTRPLDEFRKDDPSLGNIENFDYLNDWIEFDLLFDDKSLSGSVNGNSFNLPVGDMPYCYNNGVILFQTAYARACIASLHVEMPT